MTMWPSARGRRAGTLCLALTISGCGGVAINVGVAGDTDPCTTISGFCSADRPPPQGQVGYTLSGVAVALAPKAAGQVGPSISFIAIDPGDRELEVRVWAPSTGTYRCEDPANAQRTRIELLAREGSFTSVLGGQCAIQITHLPEGDDRLLEGTFTARLMRTEIFLPVPGAVDLGNGSFHIDVQPY